VTRYPKLAKLAASINEANVDAFVWSDVTDYLVDIWLREYPRSGDTIVETELAGFSYLFDHGPGRLIAAWGMSRGRHAAERDHSRMSGHPRSGGPHYIRGHAIPHRLGGPTDINIVPQLATINGGAFRKLENQAVKSPGAFYFTHWIYGAAAGRDGQTPARVEQGLIVPGAAPIVRDHVN
jgi:hypothetical protein